MSQFTLSKTLQALIDDAREAGYTVTVKEWGQNVIGQGGVDVDIEHGPGKAEVYVHYLVQNDAPNNSRLGFQTTSHASFRFDYATGRDYRGDYVTPKSVRQARFALGLPV